MATFIYWLVIKCYSFAIRIASLFNPKAKLFIEGRKHLPVRMHEALKSESRERVWMHCASLGEFEQGRTVLEKLRLLYPDYAFVLTFFSPSGYEVRKNYDGADYIFYLPLDSNKNAKMFLDIVQPQLCLFVKYEFWYFFLSNIARRQLTAILISAIFRKDQPFFKWYGSLQRRMLTTYSKIFVQNNESAQLLKSIGVENVIVSGDTRFDRVIEAVQQPQKGLTEATIFTGKNKIIVAGSTWKEDEVFLEKALHSLSPEWKLILVPHEVDAKHITEIEQLFENITIRWSKWDESSNKRVLIVDKVGLLLQLYRYADVAWIGGGFGSDGVHNVLEAAVYGVPCAYGPIYHQFIEAEELINAGGAISYDNADIFARQLQEWETSNEMPVCIGKAAKDYVFSKGKATEKIISYLLAKKLLKTI